MATKNDESIIVKKTRDAIITQEGKNVRKYLLDKQWEKCDKKVSKYVAELDYAVESDFEGDNQKEKMRKQQHETEDISGKIYLFIVQSLAFSVAKKSF